MLVKRIAIIIGALLITPLCPVSIAQTETVSDNKADLCPNDWDYIPKALITLLGAPQSCDVLKYKQSEFGFYSTDLPLLGGPPFKLEFGGYGPPCWVDRNEV